MINPYIEKKSELLEHEAMLEDLKVVLNTQSGTRFIKYLLKYFGFGDLPVIGAGEIRDDHLGFLRAGKSLFEIVAQADETKAGLIIASIYKEKKDGDDRDSD